MRFLLYLFFAGMWVYTKDGFWAGMLFAFYGSYMVLRMLGYFQEE